MDEYVGAPRSHSGSFHYYVHHHLFNHVDINPAMVFVPDGMVGDLAAECAAYESKMKALGGVDLFIAGLITAIID
jgi:glucosamine-6-phosphate deaminase